MKTETRRKRSCDEPGSVVSPVSVTLPSAPESTTPEIRGGRRSGSRKNAATAIVRIRSGSASQCNPKSQATDAATAIPKTRLAPSGAR